jgi:hypothetical protein
MGMKRSLIVSLALVFATAVVPNVAHAATTANGGATVCGRVNAPQQKVLALAFSPGENLGIVIARSPSETVETTVAPDGSYCFYNLHVDLHTFTAFGDDVLDSYQAQIVPSAGTTTTVDLKPNVTNAPAAAAAPSLPI